MKPEKAEKVTTACDVCVASVIHAQDAIRENLDIDYSKEVHYTLKVPSQAFPEVFAMSYSIGFQIELDVTYKEDEWSLYGYYYDLSTDFKVVSHEIWSPGA